MTIAERNIVQATQSRLQTESELITVACRSGCRSVQRAKAIIESLTRRKYLHRRKHKNYTEVWVYLPGERYVEAINASS